MSISALKDMGKLNYQYSEGMKSVKERKLATDHSTIQKMPKSGIHTMTTLNQCFTFSAGFA
jgi:hypothetical protein